MKTLNAANIPQGFNDFEVLGTGLLRDAE